MTHHVTFNDNGDGDDKSVAFVTVFLEKASTTL